MCPTVWHGMVNCGIIQVASSEQDVSSAYCYVVRRRAIHVSCMSSSPWRVSATSILCLSPPHLTLHHPPQKCGFQFVASVVGAPGSFLILCTRRLISRPC